jgi:hypothetical protein
LNGLAAAPGYRRDRALLGNAGCQEKQVFAGSGRRAKMPGKGVIGYIDPGRWKIPRSEPVAGQWAAICQLLLLVRRGKLNAWFPARRDPVLGNSCNPA